ncbi:MAG: LysR family transcriptional regulator [Armatimonadetes bacterium]|nr:LysR family transcriptional regulator [Armatimonadota bacterium]
MEMRHLITFQKVVETGSFTRAAGLMFLTQPAVSHQIHQLEEEFGVKLLERVGRRIYPTYAGEVLYEYVKRMLDLAEEARLALADLRTGETGRVTVAAIGTMTVYKLPELLHEFRLAHPGVEVSLKTANAEEVEEMVMNNQADVGIVGSHISTQEFVTVPLFEDRIVPVVAPRHRYASAGKVALSDLAKEPLIQLGGRKSWKNYVFSMFEQAGADPRVHLEVDSIEAVKRLVEKGLGFTIIPRVAAEQEIQSRLLVPLELTDIPPLLRRILLIYREDQYLATSIRLFIDMLVSRMASRTEPIEPTAVGRPMKWHE